MTRTICYLATLAVVMNLAQATARAQQIGPAAPIAAPIATPAGGSMLAAEAAAYPSGPRRAGGFAVRPVGNLMSDEFCDSCDGCDGGGCDACLGMCVRPPLLGGMFGHIRSPFYGHYAGIDYLMFWSKGRSMPPLATTSPPGTPRNSAGVLGRTGTEILFGNEPIGDGVGNGLRLNYGVWLDPYETIGLGSRLTGVAADGPEFGRGSFNTDILAVPFFNVQLQQEDSLLASFPNQLEGSLDIETDLDVWGADTFLRAMLLRGPGYRVDFLGGYQYSRIDDGVTIHSVATSLAGNTTPGVIPGTVFDTWDSFDTRNTFHGGTVGFMTEMYHGRWTVSTLGKIAFGNMHHRVTIRGRDIITTPNGSTVRRNGGLLTQPSNIGEYEEDEMAFVPEASISLSYALTCNLKCTIGYNFMYWTRVALAGDHIDRRVDPRQEAGLPGELPAFPGIRDTDFWLMGGTVGLEGRF